MHFSHDRECAAKMRELFVLAVRPDLAPKDERDLKTLYGMASDSRNMDISVLHSVCSIFGTFSVSPSASCPPGQKLLRRFVSLGNRRKNILINVGNSQASLWAISSDSLSQTILSEVDVVKACLASSGQVRRQVRMSDCESKDKAVALKIAVSQSPWCICATGSLEYTVCDTMTSSDCHSVDSVVVESLRWENFSFKRDSDFHPAGIPSSLPV